jgi:hypothetical protein
MDISAKLTPYYQHDTTEIRVFISEKGESISGTGRRIRVRGPWLGIRDLGSGCLFDPGSGIRDPEWAFSGSRIPDLGSRVPDPRTIILRAF